jgi:hypothetical protein
MCCTCFHRRYLYLVLALIAACASRDVNSVTSQTNWFLQSGVFLVLPGAQNVKYSAAQDSTVSYDLPESHPANKTQQSFEALLQQAGWQSQSNDVFNPGAKSLMRRWGVVIVESEPHLRWVGHWTHSSGEVVSVSLTYRTRAVDDEVLPSPPLNVYIVWVSKERMELLRTIDRRQL